MQAISPALLSAVHIGRTGYVIKELQPAIDRVDLAALGAKPRRVKRVAATMGAVCAWAHLRSSGHRQLEPIENMQRFVKSGGWMRGVENLAHANARTMLKAFRQYCRDFDAGDIAYQRSLARGKKFGR